LISKYQILVLGLITPLIFFMILSFPISSYLIIENLDDFSQLIKFEIPIFIFGFSTRYLINIPVILLFSTLSSIYLLLFIKSILTPIISQYKKLTTNELSINEMASNKAIIFLVIFSSTFFIVNLINIIQSELGINTGAPSIIKNQILQNFIAISISPITEEIGFRLTTIGICTIILLFKKTNRINKLKMMWNPKKYIKRYSNENYKTHIRILYLVAILSGIVFGLSHILIGDAWQIGKVTTASLIGIIIGILYINYGFNYAILFHWAFNYFLGSYVYLERTIPIMVQINQYMFLFINFIGIIFILMILNLIIYKNIFLNDD